MALDKETLDLILHQLKEFTKERLTDEVLLGYDERDEFPEELVRAIGSDELGVQLLFVPEEYDGMGGGAFDVYRVCEAMGHIDVGIATGVLATFLGSDPIVFGGTPEQKKKWLGRIAEDGVLFAYGATEPQAGSDLASLRSTATRVEEDGQIVGYRLSGDKQWISNGGYAQVYTFLANAPGGPSWFVIERGAEGLSHGKPEDKHGIRLSNTSTVTCEDVYVPADQLVGLEEGKGLLQAQLVFGYTRVMVAAFGLGAGWAALDRAIPYSLERIQKGGPLSEKQGYTHKLIVPHAVALEAGRAFIEETAERLERGEGEGGKLNTEGAIGKYLATEAGYAAADAAIQALGGYGYTREYMVEKIKRDVRITRIYEGTSEIMEMTISRDRWQQHLKTRGQYYHDRARELEALHGRQPSVGANVAALALHALAGVLEQARVKRLTRHQHVQLRLGELIAYAEGAGALARRAARSSEGSLDERTDHRFSGEGLAAVSRVYARHAAQRVADEGLRWVCAADGVSPSELAGFEDALGLQAIHAAQAGTLTDMDRVADVLYDRA
ncbi:acyl-CoA dehydrogenase family protein [Haliangium sp.]|uniref:acyl-CoA dehydrogenase family protein n=1 Tax=Haliangium sp. TaxID=2663208 RepID=UPI003D0EFC30